MSMNRIESHRGQRCPDYAVLADNTRLYPREGRSRPPKERSHARGMALSKAALTQELPKMAADRPKVHVSVLKVEHCIALPRQIASAMTGTIRTLRLEVLVGGVYSVLVEVHFRLFWDPSKYYQNYQVNECLQRDWSKQKERPSLHLGLGLRVISRK